CALPISATSWPRARSWLMYSSMITPVCTHTPNNARKPTPEDTLKCVPVINSPSRPPRGAMAILASIRAAHLNEWNMVYRIMKITRMVMGSTTIRRFCDLFWLAYSPAQSMRYPVGSFTCRVPFQIAAAHAVFDRDVARIRFARDLRRPIHGLNGAKLGQGYAFSRGRQQANLLDSLLRIAVFLKVADDEVVALLALQDLAYRAPADGGLHRVLHIRNVELITRGLLAIYFEVQIGLANHAKQSEVLNPWNAPHHADDLVAGVLEQFEIVAVDLDRQLPFDAAHGLLHVVGDGLRKIPDHSRDFLQLETHGGDQFLFVLVEDGTPLFLLLEIDEVLRIEEACR